MGRLRKAKVDEIVRLRNEGYTQNETAEKAVVNLKTVRKYDPLKQPKYLAVPLEERVRCLEHLVHYLLGYTYALGGEFDEEVYPPLDCPHCENKVLLLASGNELETRRKIPGIHTWACPKCGFFLDTYQRIDPGSVQIATQTAPKSSKSPPSKNRAT
jgi:hypothetical protein